MNHDALSAAAVAPVQQQQKSRVYSIETRSIDYVPLAERHGKVWHLSGIWFSGNAHLLTVSVGFLGIALGSNLIWTVIACVVGSAFGTFFMAFHSTQGPQLGLPQMVQSRPQFGFLGALFVWIVAFVIYVGYAGSAQLLVGDTMHSLSGIPVATSIVVLGVVGLLLATFGYDLIHRASRAFMYPMLVVLAIFAGGILATQPFTDNQLDLGSFSAVAFFTQFFAAAVYQLSFAIFVSDYSRYLPPDVPIRASFWWTYLGAFLSGAWLMVLGAIASSFAGDAGVAGAVVSIGNEFFAGGGNILLVATVLPLLMGITMTFYGGGLTCFR